MHVDGAMHSRLRWRKATGTVIHRNLPIAKSQETCRSGPAVGLPLATSCNEESNPACWSTYFTDLARPTYLSFIFRVIDGTIERAGSVWRSMIYRRMGSSTYIKFGELVVLYIDFILRTPFTLRLDFLGLTKLAEYHMLACFTYSVQYFG